MQAAYYCLAEDSDQTYCMPLGDAEGNIAINANNCIALNSVSSHKELAWEFIKYLLSEDVQTLPSLHGLTVNRQGFEASVTRYHTLEPEDIIMEPLNGETDQELQEMVFRSGQLYFSFTDRHNMCIRI